MTEGRIDRRKGNLLALGGPVNPPEARPSFVPPPGVGPFDRRAVGVGDHAVVFADLRVWKRAEDGWETVAQRAAGTAARE